MNPAKIVQLTNRVAFFSVGLLAYWVFIFVAITVFDFKIFRENITQAFYLSILGVFSLLGGAIILNIMLNMTRISEYFERKEGDVKSYKKPNKRVIAAALVSFPIIFGLLFLGDYRSSVKKKTMFGGRSSAAGTFRPRARPKKRKGRYFISQMESRALKVVKDDR